MCESTQVTSFPSKNHWSVPAKSIRHANPTVRHAPILVDKTLEAMGETYIVRSKTRLNTNLSMCRMNVYAP